MSVDTSVFNKLPIKTEILLRDVNEINICSRGHANKSVVVMCGSVLEYILEETLSIVDNQLYIAALNRLIGRGDINLRGRSNPIPIDELSLYELVQISYEMRILDRETYRLCELLRDYRNLIHPREEIRTSVEPTIDRANRSIDALNQAIQKIIEYFSNRQIYIINIAGIDSSFIHNKDEVVAGVRNIADSRGLNIILIENDAQLLDLINNPPSLAIVINSHGERMYMPPTPGINWREFFQRIGRNVRDRGWVFVSPAGYPFFIFGTNNTDVAGSDGLNSFLSVVGARADCMHPGPVDVTEEGSEILRHYEFGQLPHRLVFHRSAIWDHIQPVVKFYATGDLCGASAVRMGRGFFIQIGLDDTLAGGLTDANYGARIIGGLSLAFSLYLIS